MVRWGGGGRLTLYFSFDFSHLCATGHFILRKSNSIPWTTSSCYQFECTSLFICVLAHWPAKGVTLPSFKCMLGYAELTLNRHKNETSLSGWMNIEILAGIRAYCSQRPLETFSLKCIHVSPPIHRNYKRKLSLMLVYIAAVTRYFIQSSFQQSEKHVAIADTTDNYYTKHLNISWSLTHGLHLCWKYNAGGMNKSWCYQNFLHHFEMSSLLWNKPSNFDKTENLFCYLYAVEQVTHAFPLSHGPTVLQQSQKIKH